MAGDARLICRSDELVDGGKGVRFELPGAKRPIAAFAVRYGGRIYGYWNFCPHAGSELDWQPGEFFDESGLYLMCATHGAVFAPENGYCLGGPCARQKLVSLDMEERDGNVYLMND
ncbi:MAG: Rieske 2Fe-2S domain-containing protein [Burkholderiales bacterium]